MMKTMIRMMIMMMITLMMVMMTTTHLDGVPLVPNPGVGFIGGQLWHHVSVEKSNLDQNF